MLNSLGIDNPEDMYPDLVPESDEMLLSPDEEHDVMLELQPVHVRNGDNHIEHLQSHINLRNSIYLSAPPFLLEILDSHIKVHQKKLQAAQQQQAMQMAMTQGQTPNSSPNTIQGPGNDNQMLK